MTIQKWKQVGSKTSKKKKFKGGWGDLAIIKHMINNMFSSCIQISEEEKKGKKILIYSY
jgi:hypothetical protein